MLTAGYLQKYAFIVQGCVSIYTCNPVYTRRGTSFSGEMGGKNGQYGRQGQDLPDGCK